MRRGGVIAISILAALMVVATVFAAVVIINQTRFAIAELLPGVSSPGHSFGGDEPRRSEDPDLGPMDVYDVLADGTLDPAADGIAAEVWDAFTRVASLDFAAETVLTYEVGDSDESDLLAWVIQDEDDPQYWHLAVNLSGAVDAYGELDLSYLLTTMVHEFGHILTLEESQAPSTPDCELELPSQGCWYDDAYLAAYWQEFWSDYGEDAPSSENEDSDVQEAFYADHEDDFVTEYAAKNVVEDIAESFMAYVIEPVPDPSSSVVAAKMAFFDQYPELAAIRERIRAEFGSELQAVWDD